MSPFSILLVDDDPDVLDTMKGFLRSLDHPVVTASGAKEAMAILEHTSVGVIISDLNMPEVNGLGLLKQVRDKGYATPFVMLTGYGDGESALEAFRLGAFDFIEKPFKGKALMETVQRAAILGTRLLNIKDKTKSA